MRKEYRVWVALGAIGITSLGACTTRGMYESRQQDARTACLNENSGIDRDECLRRNSQSYDEYTRERKKAQQDMQ